MSFSRIGLVVGLIFAATLGCGDSCCPQDPIAGKPQACNINTECEGTDAFRFGKCIPGGCETDADCCPGTRCRADVNTCFPILLDNDYACEQSGDCLDPGQRCINTVVGERDPLPTCVYELCSGDADCGFGRTCYASHCVVTAPCGGHCPDDTACDLITGKCAPFPNGSLNCDQDCGGSSLRIFSDATTMSGEQCCPLACECKGLPPIVPTRFGRYSRVAFATDEVLVSAYDAQFGDLVLAHFKTDGSFSRLDYLDGVPVGSAVIADPLGPRGGVFEVGANVGTHTSIAVDAAGLARIAYHDEDGRSLKVAIEQATGGFVTQFVDGGDAAANIGQFTDIAVGNDGTIFVTYLAHNATLAGQPGVATGIKLARSRTPNPSSAADWDLIVLDARPLLDPCGGTCAAGNACVLNSGAPQCLPEANGCTPSCNDSETCVQLGAGAVACAPPSLPPESAELPRGRGLYSSITLDGGSPVVVYYDAIDGDLRAARFAANVVSTAVVDGDGQAGRRTGDTGRFPSVARIGVNLTIVYEDFGRHEVRSWQGAASDLGAGGTYALVDRGQEAGRSGKLFVGAGARLAQGHDAPVVVYQDASNLNLKLASFDGTAWAPRSLITEGAHGFYSDIVIAGGNAFIVSVEARLDDRGVEASRLGLTVQPVP